MENRYLSGEYAATNPTYHVEDSAWKAQQILAMLKKHALHPKTVCEIGCGAGEILKLLQEQLPAQTRLDGFEISPQAFELARLRQNEQLHFHCEDFLAKDVAPFELLLCVDVFEHVEDYMGFLRKLRGKSAYTIFHIPLDMSAQGVWRIKTILANRLHVGHLHYFSKDTALLTLKDTGYKVVDWFYTASGIDRAKSFGARAAALPRRLAALINQDFAARVLGGYSMLVLAKADS
ncbi:MAG TPA: class I SAM-dependent methyltransferase [Planctomycetota bacterium]|nr:class I SAM-dependent methyltransferase [Planctomycetota bacterium]